MDYPTRPDPNKESNDPMIPEYWLLGEDVQDKIRAAGYEASEVDGIAVDIHDLLQSADRIRGELGPKILSAPPEELSVLLSELASEFQHILWHCEAATAYLADAQNTIRPSAP